jgi:glucosamine kinase
LEHFVSRACHGTAHLAYSLDMRMVLGFDGGGTKTECVLMDENRNVRACERSGPSNPMRVGFGGALLAICEAGQMAMRNAHVSLAEISAVCAGLAGAGQPESERKMKKLLAEEFPGKLVRVCTDLDLTLEATGTGPAIVLIAGTGSAAFGRGRDGQIARVGGHGPLLGDEGSAYEVGQQAAIEALRVSDRDLPDSPLAAKILSELRITDWEEFHLRVYKKPDEVFPRIFPVVTAAAEEGDEAAQKLLLRSARRLAALVADLVERLHLKSQKFLLLKSGGMVGRSAYFDAMVDEQLKLAAPHAQFGTLEMTAAEAAAAMALRLIDEPTHGEN